MIDDNKDVDEYLAGLSVVRTALYIRVSGLEQKIHGLSIEAQQERLEKYAREKGWVIVGTYIDAGKSGRKIQKRTEFQKMIESVKRDEIDVLLICRLDRWFRSVKDYYKIMDILEKHHCYWKATDEIFNTTTSSGRLNVNIKLAVAQSEAETGSERIKVVFDSKIMHGTVTSGKCPFGYRVNKQKKLEISPKEAEIVKDAFRYYELNHTERGTITYIRESYGVNWCDATFRRMLKEELYTGCYNRNGRTNLNFCPPIISNEQFQRVQELFKQNVKQLPTSHCYIFTSLLICEECKHKLVGYRTRSYYYYRCNQHFQRGKCSHNHSMPEAWLETWLFENLEFYITNCKLRWDLKQKEKKKSSSSAEKAALKNKLTKLKDLYLNDLIDRNDYKKDYELYASALTKLEQQEKVVDTPPNFEALNQILTKDFRNLYQTLSREEQRSLWRNVIKEIHIDNNRNISHIFFR